MNTQNHLLEILSRYQNTDGSFNQETIPESTPRKSIYYTAVILISLRNIPDSLVKKSMSEKGCSFLKKHISLIYSWNYIARNEASPYPDDLDDTFLALAALSLYEPTFITPECFVGITNLLISQETTPGGPYRTWITQDSSWDNVDIIVNSSIYFFLTAHHITLPRLEEYFREKLIQGNLLSNFYHDHLVVFYFLSRAIPASLHETCSDVFNSYLLSNPANTYQEQILVDLIKNYLHEAPVYTNHSIHKTIEPFGFFIEKITESETIYSSCPTFSIALALELAHLRRPPIVPAGTIFEVSFSKALSSLSLFIEKDTYVYKKLYEYLENLKQHPALNFLFATELVTQSLNSKLKPALSDETITYLNLATLLGWIGFTLQDDIADRECSPIELPLATAAITAVHKIINQVLFGISDSTSIETILMRINEHLLRETTFYHLPIINNTITYSAEHITPTELVTSSQKSLGLAIGPIALCYLLPSEQRFQQASLITQWYELILTIKQTLDDMHDWYQDLERGFINPVAIRILAHHHAQTSQYTIHCIHDESLLTEIFWDQVFESVTNELCEYLTKAKLLVPKISILDNHEFLFEMTTHYEQALNRARDDYDQSRQFLYHYLKTTS